MSASPVTLLRQLEGQYNIVRFGPNTTVPATWFIPVAEGRFFSFTRTDRETSIVAPVGVIEDGDVDGPWVGWYVEGPISFGLTGVVDSLVGPLARDACPVFVVSTFDSDIVMVPSTESHRAAEALIAAGHTIL